jgi:hypothetical protein
VDDFMRLLAENVLRRKSRLLNGHTNAYYAIRKNEANQILSMGAFRAKTSY